MKVEEIRPTALMAESSQLRAQDLERILSKRSQFVEVQCPACSSDEYEQSFDKDGFKFVTCSVCDTLFINPRPSAEMLADHYKHSLLGAYWDKKIFPASEETRRAKIFAPRAERVVQLCKQYGVKGGRLLDVGAGFGTFSEEVERLQYFDEVVAVEPSKDLAESCRRKGLKVIEKPVEEIQAEHADVITNFELIEHLFCPQEFIEKCANLLSKGGLFIITTPNIKGFDLLVLRELSDNIAGPNHLTYFNGDSLGVLLKRCGLEVVETLTPGKLDAQLVRDKAQNGAFDIQEQPFLKEVLIDRWEALGEPFQQFLADNNLSSHLWIVARKRG